MAQRRYYGAKRDPPDSRDFKIHFKDIPSELEVDLSKYVHGVYDQRKIGSCTANAVCAAYRIDLNRQGLPDFDPSRLFLYYNAREIEKKVDEDSGAYLRDTVKALKSQGVCREKCWPYENVQLKCKIKPSLQCYQEAKGNIVRKYESIQNYSDVHQLRACLKAGYPFVFSFKVFPSFEDATISGVMKMPTEKELQGEPEGMHAVVAVGYDDRKKTIKVLNSWGHHWGYNGYFYMPYGYITNRQWCYDFWKIEFVQEASERPTGTKEGVIKQSSRICTLL